MRAICDLLNCKLPSRYGLDLQHHQRKIVIEFGTLLPLLHCIDNLVQLIQIDPAQILQKSSRLIMLSFAFVTS